MELLNSKIDHADYQCDNTPWGVALCERLGSEHFKLLYDIYHMQIMEGNLSLTLRNNIEKIKHIQIADHPGRNEPGTGEINYNFLLKYIQSIGYKGYIGCEYNPYSNTEDGLTWLNKY